MSVWTSPNVYLGDYNFENGVQLISLKKLVGQVKN